ncbi:Hypothetical predicted protein [Pelobates cultripes]|uniref:Uncharacterized protein n=1 Tax=Pelobates cultripes TaxID=61616 RepID=A0AAD1W5P9_PELCU|nr:Hypothetical predicted protein [Pelobates cultripes]
MNNDQEKKITETLMASLHENRMLAKEYKTLQSCYLDEQDKLMSVYEERLKMEITLRDYLQISVLQSKMHRALLEFFKQRGLYNQAGLATFQAASQENAQKILAVQAAWPQQTAKPHEQPLATKACTMADATCNYNYGKVRPNTLTRFNQLSNSREVDFPHSTGS